MNSTDPPGEEAGPLRKLCQPKSVSAVGSGGFSALGSVKSESENVAQ
jgi:hypothetical protein